ncbi:MAG: putative DNA binding domain-containing protein [Candidatus Lindowbacteria bacterium]|nr:putative DNA binding domain-containing protein [Candidatus Lindowbacteria bacterium]
MVDKFDWLLQQSEGQFFERKCCYDHSGDKPKRRAARDVARDIAETITAMANADGGTLVLGIEDDGAVTGVNYPDDRMETLRRAPQTNVRPPLKTRWHSGTLHNKTVLVCEVDWSADVHQLTDGRYLLRVGDQNMPFDARDIEAMKEGKRRRVSESRFITEALMTDLDLDLVAELARRTGLELSPEETLIRYHLAERRNGKAVLTLAALLLFGRDPGRWHPRCGIDFVKFEGTERHVGAALNIIKRERVEAPLARLIAEVYRTIQPHLRERQRLVDLFFEEKLEYPAFAWQEAIVNAVAHRDYRYEGLAIEVWMFDDRIEVRSPGELVEPVTLKRLINCERVHASRNPRIVRVLTDFGYMRDQGEGIPRMCETMEREGLYPPVFRLEAEAIFSVTLKNTVAYNAETIHWLDQFKPLGLSGNQKRVLAYAKEHENSFTSRSYQKLTGVDLYTASKEIKDLIRKSIVKLPRKGGRVYKVLATTTRTAGETPLEYKALEPILKEKGQIKNEDIRRALGVSQANAKRIARRLVEAGLLRSGGDKRGRYYYSAT